MLIVEQPGSICEANNTASPTISFTVWVIIKFINDFLYTMYRPNHEYRIIIDYDYRIIVDYDIARIIISIDNDIAHIITVNYATACACTTIIYHHVNSI